MRGVAGVEESGGRGGGGGGRRGGGGHLACRVWQFWEEPISGIFTGKNIMMPLKKSIMQILLQNDVSFA